jgi:hypothetical protein
MRRCLHLLRGKSRVHRTRPLVPAPAENIEPHYTTISNFVSGMEAEIKKVFSEVLLVCHELKLIQGKRKNLPDRVKRGRKTSEKLIIPVHNKHKLKTDNRA